MTTKTIVHYTCDRCAREESAAEIDRTRRLDGWGKLMAAPNDACSKKFIGSHSLDTKKAVDLCSACYLELIKWFEKKEK